MERKTRVNLVHRGVWSMRKLTVPLACGYIKARALMNEAIAETYDLQILNYGGDATVLDVARDAVFGTLPSILAFSVYGWNFHLFGKTAATYRQIHPDGWVVMGGPHVANQGPRVFALYPAVDVVVDGEGETVFEQLLLAHRNGCRKDELHQVNGITFRDAGGHIVKTTSQPRLENLDCIPSPFLTGAFPLVDQNGESLYDAITMETNRGCPYKCSFCYWGGAIGAKLHSFSRDRLREELELFGRHKVEYICLADANFGMTREDEAFLDDVLAVRRKYGYPRRLITSWAKNKADIFYRILSKMRKYHFLSDYTLSLQTLDEAALETSQRRNMKFNDFADLCTFLRREQLGAHVELIWQLPGETYESFMAGYDRIAEYISKIAIYDNLIMPNTHYHEHRDKYALITVSGEDQDFDKVISHTSMSYADNVKMHHFIFWARLLAERMYLRNVFAPLRVLYGMKQSEVLLSFDAWIESQHDPCAERLKEFKREVVRNLDATMIDQPLRFLYDSPAVAALIARWWEEAIVSSLPEDARPMLREVFAYDEITRPITSAAAKELGLEYVRLCGIGYFKSRPFARSWDIPGLVRQCVAGADATAIAISRHECRTLHFYYRAGFEDQIDNQDVIGAYAGKMITEIQIEASQEAPLWDVADGAGFQRIVADGGMQSSLSL